MDSRSWVQAGDLGEERSASQAQIRVGQAARAAGADRDSSGEESSAAVDAVQIEISFQFGCVHGDLLAIVRSEIWDWFCAADSGARNGALHRHSTTRIACRYASVSAGTGRVRALAGAGGNAADAGGGEPRRTSCGTDRCDLLRRDVVVHRQWDLGGTGTLECVAEHPELNAGVDI